MLCMSVLIVHKLFPCPFRIRFGSNNLFVYNNPTEAAVLKKKKTALRDITFEYAQDEIAKHFGLEITQGWK